jgi:hypothetical protein
MALTDEDKERLRKAEENAGGAGKSISRDPTEAQKLSPFTVICIVLNRMIGECSKIQIHE